MPTWYTSKIWHTKDAWFKREITFIGDLLNPLGHMEGREEIISKWVATT